MCWGSSGVKEGTDVTLVISQYLLVPLSSLDMARNDGCLLHNRQDFLPSARHLLCPGFPVGNLGVGTLEGLFFLHPVESSAGCHLLLISKFCRFLCSFYTKSCVGDLAPCQEVPECSVHLMFPSSLSGRPFPSRLSAVFALLVIHQLSGDELAVFWLCLSSGLCVAQQRVQHWQER